MSGTSTVDNGAPRRKVLLRFCDGSALAAVGSSVNEAFQKDALGVSCPILLRVDAGVEEALCFSCPTLVASVERLVVSKHRQHTRYTRLAADSRSVHVKQLLQCQQHAGH